MDTATENFLDNDRSPSRKVKELDTRGSHFYLALYWAEALANQDRDIELKTLFNKLHDELRSKESQITNELIQAQGTSQEIGGYYKPNTKLVEEAMRPSATLNAILNTI